MSCIHLAKALNQAVIKEQDRALIRSFCFGSVRFLFTHFATLKVDRDSTKARFVCMLPFVYIALMPPDYSKSFVPNIEPLFISDSIELIH